MPDIAIAAGAAVVGTGRSDFPNQINNVLAFPGIFRGALDARATQINEEMKIAAAYAIASLVSDEELNPEYILPNAFDERVGKTVAKAVFDAAHKTGVNRK
jgi:malate dehydrogenase (oxaloacetate-decarboxylating)